MGLAKKHRAGVETPFAIEPAVEIAQPIEQRVEERTAELVGEIAERKQAEDALRESDAQLNAYFNSSPAGMSMLDRQLRYLKVNQRLADITGLPIEEHKGKTIREIVPLLADMLEPLYLEVFATGKPIFDWELSYQKNVVALSI